MTELTEPPNAEVVWEIHLVYSLVNQSPSDETMIIAATDDREEAIAWARELSERNPPEVGPVYREGESDAEYVRSCNKRNHKRTFERLSNSDE